MFNNHRQKISEFYEKNAESLCNNYNTVSALKIYTPVLHEFPNRSSTVLDIGCGSGRDSAWLASNYHIVTAVDASEAMLTQAQKAYGHYPITWVHDTLPELSSLNGKKFDVILINAVWMHLSVEERTQAYNTLYNLMYEGSKLMISLRMGVTDPERPMFPLDPDEETQLSSMFPHSKIVPMAQDQLKRNNVEWKMIILER